MMGLRYLLLTFFLAIAAYTILVIIDHGANLLPVFFGDIAEMGWPGQFNVDFLCFLILSAIWLAWRHEFSPAGYLLGLCGLLGGMFFLSAYLLYQSYQAEGDLRVLLLGPSRL